MTIHDSMPPRLSLFARDPDLAWPLERAETELRSIGLIGARLDANRFRAGDGFLELITFLGCAPRVPLEVAADGAFCHIELPPVSAHATLWSGDNLRPPRCPHCDSLLIRESSDAAAWTCSGCGRSTPLRDINWRRRACYARSVVHVWNVHESEAVPTSGLLTALRDVSDGEWDYCYIR